MPNIVFELTEEEKALLIKHLEGLSRLYSRINGSGSGPVRSFISKINLAQSIIEFEDYKIDSFLLHLEGASGYEMVVYGSDPLRGIIERIRRTRGY